MERGTKQRLFVDTAPLGAGDRLLATEPRVWPWYAAGSACLALALLVAQVDVRADAAPSPLMGQRLGAMSPAPSRPALVRPVAPLDAPADAPVEAVGAVAVGAAREGDNLTARSLNSLGYAARKKGDHASARLLYKEAMAADPRHVWSRFNLACELALMGDLAGALALLEEVDRIGGPDADKALGQHAPRDADLEALATHPRFRALTRAR
ncbi:MAG: hypothetical protein IT385_05875 [Deltaproteobacteria bacterium]|nr:hypothetical protein [Deltaproteobacteria bacterium]